MGVHTFGNGTEQQTHRSPCWLGLVGYLGEEFAQHKSLFLPVIKTIHNWQEKKLERCGPGIGEVNAVFAVHAEAESTDLLAYHYPLPLTFLVPKIHNT